MVRMLKLPKIALTAAAFLALSLSWRGWGLLSTSWANPPTPAAQPSQLHTIATKTGPQWLEARISINAHGMREVTYELLEQRTILPNSRIIILYGRDLDGDLLPDAWFLVRHGGETSAFDRPAITPDGWDIAEKLLIEERAMGQRSAAEYLLSAVLTHLSMAGSTRKDSLERLIRMGMDLQELEIRATRIRAQNPKADVLPTLDSLILEGWKHLQVTAKGEETRKQLAFAVGDVALLFVGGAIIKGLLIPAKWLVPKFISEFAAEASEKVLGSISETAAKAIEQAGKVAGRTGEHAIVTVARMSIDQRIRIAIHGLYARGIVGRQLALTLAKTWTGLKAGVGAWKYIASSTAIQLVAEVFTRHDALFSTNPIVLTEKVVTDADLIQNLSYMTLETFDTTVIAKTIPYKPHAFAIAGVFSTINSIGAAYFIKGDTDGLRVALDTSWEVGVGNSQVIFDNAMLHKFEMMASRQNNPKLKLIGYGIVFVDQAVGYLTYAEITRRFENWRRTTKTPDANFLDSSVSVEFVPILASA